MQKEKVATSIAPFVGLALFFGALDNIPAQARSTGSAVDTADVSGLGCPPGEYHIESQGDRLSIPFELYRDKLRFKAEINGRECFMTLDNGSLWDEILFFGSPKVDSLGFQFTQETSFGMTQADLDTNVSIRVGDVVFSRQKAVVSRYESDRPNPWEGFDGQLSATLFKHFVVRIDFDDSVIELIPPDSFAYSGDGQEFGMKAGPYGSRMIEADIELSDSAVMTLDLIIDLGGLYPLYLPIGKYDVIGLPPDAVEAGLGTGFLRQRGYVGKVSSLRLGRYALRDVSTAFTPVDKDADAFGNTMIGFPLLRTFNVVFDYFSNRIILEPSASYEERRRGM